VRLAGAIDLLKHFVTEYGIPVVSARNGNDIFEYEDKHYIGHPGTYAQRGANFAVQTCDFYLAIGTRLSLAQTGYNAEDYAKNAFKVVVDIDNHELHKDTINIDMPVHCDAKIFLEEVIKIVSVEKGYIKRKSWLDKCLEWKHRYPVCLPEYEAEINYVNSYYFINELSEIAPDECVVVTDMGFAFQNTHQAFRVKAGQRLYTNSGHAAMGWGLPAAIGGAESGQAVIAIVGDGGFMMNMQELATISNFNYNIKIILLNNQGYLTIKQTQEFGFDGRLFGCTKETGLSFPDFEKIASSFGLSYMKIENHSQLKQKKNSIFNDNKPILIEVMMNPDQMQAPRSMNKRDSSGKIIQTTLENSFPFLPQEVIDSEMTSALILGE